MKLGAAFLAGILLAMGGAVLYVRSNEAQPKPAVQSAPVSPTVSIPTADAIQPPAPEQPEAKSAITEPKPISAPAPAAKPRVTRRPVSLAVSKPQAPVEGPRTVAQDQPPTVGPPDQMPLPTTASPSEPPMPSPAMSPARDQPQPHTVTLASGTTVWIRLAERLSTDHNYPNDTFRATLDAPIIVDGFIIAEKGSKVLGTIVRAQRPGKMSGLAELSIALTELNTTDGQRIRIQTNESIRKGPSNTNQEVLKMGGGAALGAIIGAIAGGGKGAAIGAGAGGAAGTGAVLLGHGKPAAMDTETKLSFQLSSPATITEKLH